MMESRAVQQLACLNVSSTPEPALKFCQPVLSLARPWKMAIIWVRRLCFCSQIGFQKGSLTMDKTDLAAHYHDIGYGCAQSVLCAFTEDFGLEEETALRLSTGFGSGMGRLCEMCGALAGGCMVIGLKYGKVITDGSKYGTETEITYRLTAEMARRFAARNGAIRCWDLLHLDLSQQEDRQRALDEGIFQNQCGKYIQDVVEILVDILPDPDLQGSSTPQVETLA